MIEDRFRKWLILEMDGVYVIDDLKHSLTDKHYAEEMWEDFSRYHRNDFVELVIDQVKALLKKIDREKGTK